MVKPAKCQAQAAKPATAAASATHVLAHLARVLSSPLPGDNAGPRRSAASASRAAGSVGAGYGVPNPMSSHAQPVPHALGAVASSVACWGACGVCDCAADTGAAARACKRSAGARAGAGQAQALPDGNHGDINQTAIGSAR